MRAEAASGFIDVHGGGIYYETAGTGYPLVLIHAGIADLRMWDDQLPAFAEQYRVIRYDVRDLGRSHTQPVRFSHTEDLLQLLEALDVERSYLLGISMGGSIAVDFTVQHPDRVGALIAVAPGVSGFQASPDERLAAAFAEMDEASEQHDMDRLLELEMRLWVDGPGQRTDRVHPRVRARAAEMERANLRNETEDLEPQKLRPPAVERLDAIAVPTLVILGDLDVSSVNQTGDQLASRIPRTEKVVFEGAAHMLPLEQPEHFAQVVLGFVGKVEQRPAAVQS